MPKKKVTIWIDEAYAEKLEKMARVEGLPVSQYGAVLLERGIAEDRDKLGMDLLEQRMKTILQQNFTRMTEAMTKVMLPAALDARVSLLLLQTDYKAKFGEETLTKHNKKARQYAKESILKNTKALGELVELKLEEDERE